MCHYSCQEGWETMSSFHLQSCHLQYCRVATTTVAAGCIYTNGLLWSLLRDCDPAAGCQASDSLHDSINLPSFMPQLQDHCENQSYILSFNYYDPRNKKPLICKPFAKGQIGYCLWKIMSHMFSLLKQVCLIHLYPKCL